MSYMLLTGRNPFPGANKDEIKRQICQKHLDFTKDYWTCLSRDAIDFVKNCLKRIPKDRFSAQKLLDHPWMVKMSEPNRIDSKTVLDVTQNLTKFVKANKFQKTMISVLTGLKSDKNDLKRVETIFKSLDDNKDGVLNQDEIESLKEEAGIPLGFIHD